MKYVCFVFCFLEKFMINEITLNKPLYIKYVFNEVLILMKMLLRLLCSQDFANMNQTLDLGQRNPKLPDAYIRFANGNVYGEFFLCTID